MFSALLIILFQLNSSEIDSLKNLIAHNPDFSLITALNNYYIRSGMFDSANVYLKKYEDRYAFEEQAQLNYLMAENFLFKGDLQSARDQYLRTVARFSNARYANEALDKLHLLESTRKDTVVLKRFIKAIYSYETGEINLAEDSLKILVNSTVGDYALYYLAMVYHHRKDHNQALSALEQLKKDFPANRIHEAKILIAEIYFELGKEKDAKKILEEIIVKDPSGPISIKAREILRNKGTPDGEKR
jgi:tetratricopeptide (TPR) repeat protein